MKACAINQFLSVAPLEEKTCTFLSYFIYLGCLRQVQVT